MRFHRSPSVDARPLLAASLFVIYATQLTGPLWGQTWNKCSDGISGPNFCASSGAKVGIGMGTSTNPYAPLQVQGASSAVASPNNTLYLPNYYGGRNSNRPRSG